MSPSRAQSGLNPRGHQWTGPSLLHPLRITPSRPGWYYAQKKISYTPILVLELALGKKQERERVCVSGERAEGETENPEQAPHSARSLTWGSTP